ncbi:MAG TPA: universal stress protein [Rhodanobacteraceae bacterium]|nr:universal stress protein [Rhodanobacteraceae bacterium]
MFKHILIPIDDDPGSRRALAWGVELARSVGARITGFHAMTEFAHPGIVDELLEPPAEELRALARAHADKLLAPLQGKAGRAGVPCDTLAERGDRPWEAIVAAARKSRCDLIVMASHGRRGIARLVLGSQTQQVLAHTGIPVLVVR